MPEKPVLTRNQTRAKTACRCISSDEAKNDKDYPKIAKKFPTLIHNCGLAQAVAFVQAKEGETGKTYLNHLSSVMGLPKRDLESQSRAKPLIGYLRLSREAIESATWIKRYSEALLKENGS